MRVLKNIRWYFAFLDCSVANYSLLKSTWRSLFHTELLTVELCPSLSWICCKTDSCCNWGGSHESAITCWRMSNSDDYMGIDVTHTNPSRCLVISITKNFFYFTNKFPPGRGHGRSYNCIWLFLFLLRKQSKLPYHAHIDDVELTRATSTINPPTPIWLQMVCQGVAK